MSIDHKDIGRDYTEESRMAYTPTHNSCTASVMLCMCVWFFPHLIYQIKVVQCALVGAISVVYSHVHEYNNTHTIVLCLYSI